VLVVGISPVSGAHVAKITAVIVHIEAYIDKLLGNETNINAAEST
jgi:hypothetical protein